MISGFRITPPFLPIDPISTFNEKATYVLNFPFVYAEVEPPAITIEFPFEILCAISFIFFAETPVLVWTSWGSYPNSTLPSGNLFKKSLICESGTNFSFIIIFAIDSAISASLPGVGETHKSELAAVNENRGSTWAINPLFPDLNLPKASPYSAGEIQFSIQLAPNERTLSALAMSKWGISFVSNIS